MRRGGAEGEEEREGLLSGFIIVGRAWTTQWMLARNHTEAVLGHGTTHARHMQRRHGQHKAKVNGVMIRREESW